MLTSYDILEALDNQTDVIVETLNAEKKRQFIGLLSKNGQAEDEKGREDAVDALVDFCRNFPAIDKMLNNVKNFYREGITRGEPDFNLTEKEKKMRLYANRLIKATERSLEQDQTSKENTNEHD